MYVLRALRELPGGIARFMPCDIGANHGRLRHVGSEGSGHELTSRPQETSSLWMLDEPVALFGYSCIRERHYLWRPSL